MTTEEMRIYIFFSLFKFPHSPDKNISKLGIFYVIKKNKKQKQNTKQKTKKWVPELK